VPATLRVPVIVGTGPVVLPLPAEGAPIIVTDRPRHGRLRAFDAAGVELPLDAEPMALAMLRYEPPPLMRRGLDRLTLAAVAPAGAGRSLGGSADATAPAGAESGPVIVQGPRVAVQLEIGVDACDREAGIRFDQHGVVLGLFPEEVQSERAVAACRAAVERFPEVARFHFQLGIAVDLGGDPEAAVPHYQTAALMGHWLAVNRLGFLHLTGRGLPVDLEKARALIEIAAEQGESHALNNLGRAYLVGEIVPADREKAVDLLLEAAAKGNTFAYNALGRLLLDEGDAERAVPLFRQAAEAGDIYGYNNLGWVYQNGMGVPQDLDQAINWYELAARSGQLNAPINLGFLYKDGAPGLDPDPKRAAFWFAEAARGGNLWGSVHLAQLYADGAIGDAADPVLAAKLYARVAWRDAETGRFAAQQSHGGAGVAARERFAALSSRAVVAAVQSELARLGFDPGPVDGLPGQRTEAAIEAFARSRAVSLPTDLPPIDLLGELVRVSTG
jgi:TPR repeat protein